MTDISPLSIAIMLGSIAGYAIAVVLLARSIIASNSINATANANPNIGMPLWGALAAALHLVTIAIVAVENQGLSSSFFDALSITAFIVVVVGLITQMRYPIGVLLIPVFIIAGFCLALANLYGHHSPIIASSKGMLTHILSSIIAYSLLSLATVQALALQVMERGLKDHNSSSWLRQLPPLQTMEALLFQLIGLGWLALTIAIASGGIYVDDLFAQHLAHKTVFSILSWILFALLLIGRQRYGWRGATAVKWTLSAFIALALAYFGSKFVLEVLLQRQ